MTDKTFWKVIAVFELNYSYNEDFREYVNANYTHKTSIYGSESFWTEDMRSACNVWKNKCKKDKSIFWWNSQEELDAWLDD